MIARCGVRGVGPVAVETLRPDMTAATGLRPRVGNRAVHIGNHGGPAARTDPKVAAG